MTVQRGGGLLPSTASVEITWKAVRKCPPSGDHVEGSKEVSSPPAGGGVSGSLVGSEIILLPNRNKAPPPFHPYAHPPPPCQWRLVLGGNLDFYLFCHLSLVRNTCLELQTSMKRGYLIASLWRRTESSQQHEEPIPRLCFN